jgi:hemophore-related protein
MSLRTCLVVGSGTLSLLFAGAGIAAADLDENAIANSTCTYPQVMAALTAQSPVVAKQAADNVLVNAWIQELMGASPDQRRQMLKQVKGIPETQQYAGLVSQVTNTCNNY